MKSREIYNWSRYPRVKANVYTFRRISQLKGLFAKTPKLIARGSGLSYGDASLSDEILSTLNFNKILDFDKDAGVIRCESGVTLDELLQVMVPHGWFLPVTPGTKFITIGGAVAADVHGKNHHKEGSFSRYVKNLSVMISDGKVITCNAHKNRELFHLTCGGMGLSGIILEVELELRKIQTSMIAQKNIPVKNLEELLKALNANDHYTYSVAWIDCLAAGANLGRGILMLGEHAEVRELREADRKVPLRIHKQPAFRIPFSMPGFLLNKFTTGLFNKLYYTVNRLRKNKFITHYDQFFYPLDFIKGWNRLYGKRGFLQYQFVVPMDKGEVALLDIVQRISNSGLASFLSVLKVMGEAEHPLSFGMKGYTLALDFPITPQLFPLLEELDNVVTAYGGKLYLAKDARMTNATFNHCYPKLKDIKLQLKKYNGKVKFESLLSHRLHITQ